MAILTLFLLSHFLAKDLSTTKDLAKFGIISFGSMRVSSVVGERFISIASRLLQDVYPSSAILFSPSDKKARADDKKKMSHDGIKTISSWLGAIAIGILSAFLAKLIGI